jgi:multidrug efflux pump
LTDAADVVDSVQDRCRLVGRCRCAGHHRPPAERQHHRDRRCGDGAPAIAARVDPQRDHAVAGPGATTIRASLRDVERTLVLSVAVILVVFLFLRNGCAMLIPSVAVPVSPTGTRVMYLGVSVNNFTLMALTVATGFVVDDDRCAGEHVAAYRKGCATVQGGVAGCERSGSMCCDERR